MSRPNEERHGRGLAPGEPPGGFSVKPHQIASVLDPYCRTQSLLAAPAAQPIAARRRFTWRERIELARIVNDALAPDLH